MGNPLITVAIPGYKKTYLDKAIESVIKQTYTNWELIIVDDCSPYDLKSVVGKYDDERISYHRNKVNLGGENPANNWNKCLELAKGEFFILLCDDDYYSPDFIETMLFLANKYPKCGTFRSRANIINADGVEINRYASSPEWESWDDYFWHITRNYRNQTISEWMYRTETIRKAGGYALLPLAWYADYLSILKIAQEGGIASSSKILMHFRQSGENISSRDKDNTEMKILAQKLYREEIAKMLDSNPDKDTLLGGLDWLLKLHLKYNLENASKKTLWTLYKKRKIYNLHPKWLWKALFH